jgi:integrase
MPKRSLTDLAVKRIKPPTSGQKEHFDAALPGFALRVSSKGGKSYVLFYRPKVGPDAGKLRRMTIGSAAEWKLADARDEAREWKRRVDKGEDPKLVQAEQHAEAVERAANTFGAIADEFLEKYAKRHQKSWKQTAYYLRELVMPKWADRPIDTIKRRDVIDLLEDIAESGRPVLANRTLAHIRKLFNWALDREIVETTPVARVKPPGGHERPRERELLDDEIRSLWPAFDDAGYPFGPMLKLLLLSGQRRGEVAKMRWTDLDLDAKVWNLPGEVTKNGRPHAVPLAPAALDIIGALPRFSGPYVFSTTSGEKPVSGFSRSKARIEKKVNKARKEGPLPQWGLHDLRRTCASGMARLSVPSDHIGRVLNHAPKGVTAQVYDRHTYLPEKRHALEAWASYVEGLFRPTDKKVVDLAKRR